MMHLYAGPLKQAPGDVILVDAGNSRTKFAFASGGALWRLCSVCSEPRDVAAAARICWSSRFLEDAPRLPDCVVTSVRPDLTAAIRSELSGLVRDFYSLDFGSLRGLSFASAAEFVAPDRVADTIAAASGPCPAIVIDLGTATTMDVIDSSQVHLGGAIMPGVMFTGGIGRSPCMASGPQSVISGTLPGQHAAAVLGHAGAVDRLCGMFMAEVGPARIVATGGYARDIVPHCRERITIDDDLTLRGSRIAHALWSAQRHSNPRTSG